MKHMFDYDILLSMKKYRTDIVVIAISILISLGCFGIYPLLNSVYAKTETNRGMVSVEVNGELFGTYDLDQDRTIEVKSEFGTNIVEIREGRAYVTDADCPDKLCVHDSKSGELLKEIICLPNRMVLRISEDKEAYDAFAY